MTDVRFRSDMGVEFVDSMGSDARICQAARVSVKGADAFDTGEAEGLINFLARDRHGSPFEHVTFTWMISAPIFVWREVMRHRIASYNEESGRYKQLEPVFYLPNEDRKLVQVGKAASYELVDGDPGLLDEVNDEFSVVVDAAYTAYENLLGLGVAREVSRMILPLNIYSSAFVTMNLRAAFNFLSLRTNVPDHMKFPSHPQREIEMVAELMEVDIARIAPLAYAAFHKNGRVSP